MSQEDIISVETSIESARTAIEFGKMLGRLQDTDDFQKLIEHEFFIQESVVAVELLGDTTDPVLKEQLHNNMLAISGLKRYFTKVRNQAVIAVQSLEDNETARDELLQEGLK